jgi:hypothetical protein
LKRKKKKHEKFLGLREKFGLGIQKQGFVD